MPVLESTRYVSLGPIDRIPRREGRTFDVDGEHVAVFRGSCGEVFATQARCPHRGGPLADGFVGAGKVVCPLHSFTFDLESGASVGQGCPSLRTYDVAVGAGGDVRIALPGQAEE
jgi:nitrite reductase (NADH) small subunit